jgi:hypothetical protein
MPRYPPVRSYVLLRTFDSIVLGTIESPYCLLRNAIRTHTEICARTRFHVWHMKVLLYTVFNDHEDVYARIPIAIRRTQIGPRVHSLKAEQYSLVGRPSRFDRYRSLCELVR